jgi:hypothetical protein
MYLDASFGVDLGLAELVAVVVHLAQARLSLLQLLRGTAHRKIDKQEGPRVSQGDRRKAEEEGVRYDKGVSMYPFERVVAVLLVGLLGLEWPQLLPLLEAHRRMRG